MTGQRPQWLVSQDAARKLLSAAPDPFVELLRHGTMSVELYKPDGTDTQEPHEQDELYVVMRGTGHFVKGGDKVPFKAGDVIFVEAGIEHRFVDFSKDFETLVVFWGPKGGER